MGEINVKMHYKGEFKKTEYVGGTFFIVTRVELDVFSFTVLLEFVKDYLKLTEIGGIYIPKGKKGGWHLLSRDEEIFELVKNCKNGELEVYVDTTIDKFVEPIKQPFVVVRPRKNLIQDSPKKIVKRKFVTTQQLQQQHKKMIRRSPRLGNTDDLYSQQNVVVNEKETARRKLMLENDTSYCEITGENDIPEEQLPPPPPLTEYEREKIRRMQENDKVYETLGLPRLLDPLRHQPTQNSNGKRKKGIDREVEESDAYIPENEGEDDSDDSSHRIKKVKGKQILPGPRTRSRANAASVVEKEPGVQKQPVLEKGGKKVNTVKEKEVSSSYRPQVLKPTCSKMLKQFNSGEAPPGSVAAYLALKERQKNNAAAPTHENCPELNMEETTEDDEAVKTRAPRKPRGPSKMIKVHARGPEEKAVVSVNQDGQLVSDDEKTITELSRFLGVLARDNVSLTYVNWLVVPDQLKNKLWEYALTKYVIPEDGRTWVYRTFDAAWRMHKSRMKKAYYRKYHNDEERMENRPDRIPLEDFKMLLKYWGDEAVQKIAEDNATRRQELTETHTLGPKPISLVREKLKKKDPNLGQPSNAVVYVEIRERKPGRSYQSNPDIMNTKITNIKKMINLGNDAGAQAIISDGKSHGRNWLVGRRGKKCGSTAPEPAPTKQYVQGLMENIKNDLEGELEAKVNRKVQENMTRMMKKLGEANPDLILDIADFCSIASSSQDNNGTPLTQGGATSN